ncbi:MAG: site-specific integrase, partial [Nitrososphaeria archaeon]
HKNMILSILKSFFKFCVLNYDTNHSWIDKIPSFREDVQFKNDKSEYYTIDNFNKFISGAKTHLEKTLFTVLMFSGLRIGELRAMVWSDFNYKNKSLTINKTLSSKTFNNQNLFSPKTASSNRIVFIPDEVSDMLIKLKSETENQNNQYIFSGDKSISETTIHRMNTRIAAVSGIKKIKIHEFRHSYATLMVKKGMTANVLQKQLGHSDIKVTYKYYVHSELEDQSNEVKSIFKGVEF